MGCWEWCPSVHAPSILSASRPRAPTAVLQVTLVSTRGRSAEALHQVRPPLWVGQPQAQLLHLFSQPALLGPRALLGTEEGPWAESPEGPWSGSQAVGQAREAFWKQGAWGLVLLGHSA